MSDLVGCPHCPHAHHSTLGRHTCPVSGREYTISPPPIDRLTDDEKLEFADAIKNDPKKAKEILARIGIR